METVQVAINAEKAQSKKFRRIALGLEREKFSVEPFDTEEESLTFATSLSMRQLVNER